MTKVSGNVQVLIFVKDALAYALVIPGVDFTAFNTNVNLGANGASLTKEYSQDFGVGLLPVSITVRG